MVLRGEGGRRAGGLGAGGVCAAGQKRGRARARATRATVTATGDVAGNPKPSSSSSALRDGMPTLADLNAAEQKMDGHGVGGVFAEAAKREAESKAEDLSVSGATRADREKLLAGLRDAPARERRWAAAREKEKGNELFKAREYRSAIEAYDVSIALDAANPAPFANRAAAYMKLRRWSDAARDCDAALALDPEHFKALLRRGACALEANEQDAASVALRDFELCAVIEARRRTKEGEPSDAELVRLTALAKKTLNETREKPRARRCDASPSKKMTGFLLLLLLLLPSRRRRLLPSSPPRVGGRW